MPSQPLRKFRVYCGLPPLEMVNRCGYRVLHVSKIGTVWVRFTIPPSKRHWKIKRSAWDLVKGAEELLATGPPA